VNEVEAKPCLLETNRENGVRSHGVASTSLRGGVASPLLYIRSVNWDKLRLELLDDMAALVASCKSAVIVIPHFCLNLRLWGVY